MTPTSIPQEELQNIAQKQNKLVLVLDSTQISAYMECPRLWFFQYNQHLERVDAGDKVAISMGSYGHLLLETYYKEKANGRDMSTAMQAALSLDADTYYCECGHPSDEHEFCGNESGATPCTKRDVDHCKDFKAAPVPLDAPQREQVREKFRMYCFTHQGRGDLTIPSATNVELGFSYPLFESFDRIYVLEGRIDLYNCMMGQNVIGWTDHKFQLRKRDLYKKSIQFRNYGLVTNAMFGMVNYVRLTQKNDKDTFARPIVTYAMGEHAWWKGELIKVYDKIATQLADASFDKNYWITAASQPNWAMCSGMFGYECAYTPLCSGGDFESEKNRLYKIGKEWRPW